MKMARGITPTGRRVQLGVTLEREAKWLAIVSTDKPLTTYMPHFHASNPATGFAPLAHGYHPFGMEDLN